MLSQDHDTFRICGEEGFASGSMVLAWHRDAPLLPRWSRGAVLELGCPRLHRGPTTGWLRDLGAGIYFLCTSFLRLWGRYHNDGASVSGHREDEGKSPGKVLRNMGGTELVLKRTESELLSFPGHSHLPARASVAPGAISERPGACTPFSDSLGRGSPPASFRSHSTARRVYPLSPPLACEWPKGGHCWAAVGKQGSATPNDLALPARCSDDPGARLWAGPALQEAGGKVSAAGQSASRLAGGVRPLYGLGWNSAPQWVDVGSLGVREARRSSREGPGPAVVQRPLVSRGH